MLASTIWLLKLRMIKMIDKKKVDMKKQRLDFSISL